MKKLFYRLMWDIDEWERDALWRLITTSVYALPLVVGIGLTGMPYLYCSVPFFIWMFVWFGEIWKK